MRSKSNLKPQTSGRQVCLSGDSTHQQTNQTPPLAFDPEAQTRRVGLSRKSVRETDVWRAPSRDASHILVVDDEEYICEVIQEMLADENYHVQTACDPKKAMAYNKFVSLKRIFISFLASMFGFFAFIGPVPWIQSRAFGYAFNKDRSFVLNHSISDSILGLKKLFYQTHPFSSSFSVHEEEGEELANIPILDRQDWPFVGNGHLARYHKASRTRASVHGESVQDESVTNERKSLSSPMVQRKIDYRKASIIGGLNVLAISAGFHEAINTWGESKSKFHIKDDWKGDSLAQTDEVSHFMWGYKMTQFLHWAYDWVGFSPKTSRTLSLCESSLILTLVEYPIDAYNPHQGLGVSDLIFDYLGVGMALAKKHSSWLNDFDFKISWKKNVFSENQTFFAQTYEEFDNFIYWLTYRTKLFFPKKLLCFGIGYSATRSGLKPFRVNLQGEPRREFYAGIGLSIPDFASLFGKRVGDFSKFLEILYPNIHIKQ